MKTVHLIFTILWILAIVPTLLWWTQSITWVVFMSLWANIASHVAGYNAAKAERNTDEH
jgi:hypothetical protein